jgi:hypothetical protein
VTREKLTWKDEKGREFYFDYELRTRTKKEIPERVRKRANPFRGRKKNKTKEL